MNSKLLRLDLDDLFSDPPTSDYDIGSEEHVLLIRKRDKNKIIKELSAWLADRMEESFCEVECDDSLPSDDDDDEDEEIELEEDP